MHVNSYVAAYNKLTFCVKCLLFFRMNKQEWQKTKNL